MTDEGEDRMGGQGEGTMPNEMAIDHLHVAGTIVGGESHTEMPPREEISWMERDGVESIRTRHDLVD